MLPRSVRSFLPYGILTFAFPLAAQAPPRPASAPGPAPILQSATFDVATAVQQQWRVALEPLVFARFSVGLVGTYSTEPRLATTVVAYGGPAVPCDPSMLCSFFGPDVKYRAWSFDLAARWYPAVLSLSGRRQAVAVYLGEFVGYHERRITNSPGYYNACPQCVTPQQPPQPPPDTIVPPPQPPPNPQPLPLPALMRVMHGVEPGVEAGVRLIPARHVVIDVGGRFRLATLEDPYAGARPGGVDSRLVVSVGVGW